MSQQINKIRVPIMKWILVLFCFVSCNFIREISANSESQIHITHVITSDESEPIVLDCKYDAGQDNSSLVVKWLKDEKTIYHWIKGHKPTVYPPSKGLIDEEYQQSTNPNNKYRAISFPVPTKDLSGVYKCFVETRYFTQIVEINLQVVDVSQSNIELHSVALPNDTLVTCSVENVYPQPKLLVWSNDDITLSTVSEQMKSENDGFFNSTVVVSANSINSDDEIGCTLTFPGVEFNVTKILTSSAPAFLKTTAMGLIMMIVLAISV